VRETEYARFTRLAQKIDLAGKKLQAVHRSLKMKHARLSRHAQGAVFNYG
jgi:hypothetical protein